MNLEPPCNTSGFPLLSVKRYDHFWEELILPSGTNAVLKQIVQEFKEQAVLQRYNLRPKYRILLYGEKGTGKAFTARVISSVLGLPLLRVKFAAIISPYSGGLTENLRKVFDFIENGTWLVLFDEIDIIIRNRTNHDSFLQIFEEFESKSLIFATANRLFNGIDSAVWEQFEEIIQYEKLASEDCLKLLDKLLKPIYKNDLKPETLVSEMKQLVPAEIRTVIHEALKKSILEDRGAISKADIDFVLGRFFERKSLCEKLAYDF